MFQAAIFDMDGLLIDSEPLWEDAEMAVFGRLGVPLTPERCLETRGLRITEVAQYWHDRYPWPGNDLPLVATQVLREVGERIRQRGRPLPGALAAVELARKRCSKLAVTSSSPMELIETVLDKLGLRRSFDVIGSADGERSGKPHPAVYLSTATRLGVSPSACIAFEDSLAGVLAAKAARMTCVAVPDPRQRQDPRFAIADTVLDSLVEWGDPQWIAIERRHEER